MVLNMLSPPPAQVVQTHHNSTNQKPGHHHHLSMSENHRCSSFSHHIDKRHDNELVLHVAFLGRIFYFLVINRGRSRRFHKGGPFRISKQFVIRKLKRYRGGINASHAKKRTENTMATWVFYFETGRATFLIQFQPWFWTKDHSVNNSEESVNGAQIL
jgi:hypothetical protein